MQSASVLFSQHDLVHSNDKNVAMPSPNSSLNGWKKTHAEKPYINPLNPGALLAASMWLCINYTLSSSFKKKMTCFIKQIKTFLLRLQKGANTAKLVFVANFASHCWRCPKEEAEPKGRVTVLGNSNLKNTAFFLKLEEWSHDIKILIRMAEEGGKTFLSRPF